MQKRRLKARGFSRIVENATPSIQKTTKCLPTETKRSPQNETGTQNSNSDQPEGQKSRNQE